MQVSLIGQSGTLTPIPARDVYPSHQALMTASCQVICPPSNLVIALPGWPALDVKPTTHAARPNKVANQDATGKRR